MGKTKKILISFFTLLCFVVVSTEVKAASTITITSPTSLNSGRTYIGMKDDYTVVSGDGFEAIYSYRKYPVISYKSARDTAPLLCLTGLNVVPPTANTVCTQDDAWSYSTESYGIAYLIWRLANDSGLYQCTKTEGIEVCGVPDDTNMSSNNLNYYYWMELLALGHVGALNNKDLLHSTNYSYDTFKTDFIENGKSIWLGSNEYKWNELISEARQYALSATPTITFDATQLTFTKNGTDYVSNWVTVSGNNDGGFYTRISSSSVDANNIKLETDEVNKKFRVVVSNVVDSVENITVEVTSFKSAYHATKYNCGDNIQAVVPTKVFLRPVPKVDYISGEINATTTKKTVTFEKVDEEGNKKSGAILHIKGANNVDQDINFGNQTSVSLDLLDGSYTITEVQAPNGCTKSNQSIVIQVSNGKINVEGKESSTVKFVNSCSTKKETEVLLKKVDQSGNLISGATLHIKGSNNVDEDISFGTKTSKILKLLDGSYTITEVKAPNECTKSNESIVIQVSNGKINVEGKESEYVTFENNCPVQEENVTVTIKKVDENQTLINSKSTELEIFEVVSGKHQSLMTISGGSNKISLEKDKSYAIKEVTAPEGYEELDEYITFTIDDKGVVTSSACYENCKNNVLHIVNVKEELVGEIILTIKKVDDKGNLLSNAGMIFYEKDNEENKKYSWNTKDENPSRIILEKNKTYILKEETVPDNYTGVKEATINVDEDGKITLAYEGEAKSSSVTCQDKSCKTIIVKNVTEVPVGDTLSRRSILLVVCGVTLCFAGAGLGIYTLKKKQEV